MSREVEIIEPPKAPLVDGPQWVEWQTWFDRVFKYIENTVLRGARTGDEAASVKKNQSYHGVTSLTAARTITLPPTSSVDNNHLLVVQDESGSAGTYNITISPYGTDTINGASSATISSNYGRRTLIKSELGKWFSA